MRVSRFELLIVNVMLASYNLTVIIGIVLKREQKTSSDQNRNIYGKISEQQQQQN